MIGTGPLTVHWSINVTTPPDNVCTGTGNALIAPPSGFKDGLLHIAAEANVAGAFGGSIQTDIFFISGGPQHSPPALMRLW
jgi:hypothetical protein